MRLAMTGWILALLGQCSLFDISPDPERLCRRALVASVAEDLASALDPEERIPVTICERRHVIVRAANGSTYERRQSEAATCRLPARSVARGELSVRTCKEAVTRPM